jgi:hypothetical protein
VFPPSRRGFSASGGLAALAALSAGARSGEDNLS